MGQKTPIEELTSEAEANFRASRWEDSAKTYEHLVGLAQQNEDYALAINYALAAITAWKKMSNKQDKINKLYQVIGLLGVKESAINYKKLAQEQEQKGDIKHAAGNYEEAAEGYKYLMDFRNAKKHFSSAVKLLTKLAKKAQKAKDYESAIHYYDRGSKVYTKTRILIDRMFLEIKKLGDKERKQLEKEKETIIEKKKESIIQKAKAHEKLADDFLKKKEPHYKEIAKKEYRKAAGLCKQIDELKEAKKLQKKARKL
ncbi:MAG: hypothetical protein U9O98_02090 [Asgard group archaeon]|nr:hypothetical protein [Asgard group archaeon]